MGWRVADLFPRLLGLIFISATLKTAAEQTIAIQGVFVLRFARLHSSHAMMLVAGALGIPCVALYSGVDHPGKWEPLGADHIVLRRSIRVLLVKSFGVIVPFLSIHARAV